MTRIIPTYAPPQPAPAKPMSARPMATEPTRTQHQPPRSPESYAKPFCDFLTANPTVFHYVDATAKELEQHGYKQLDERDEWRLRRGGKYYLERNGSSLIAFEVGGGYEPGNGVAMLAGHVDALCIKRAFDMLVPCGDPGADDV